MTTQTSKTMYKMWSAVTAPSQLVKLFHWQRDGGYNLVLENESFHALKDPEENEEDADILDPGEFDRFPEAGPVGGRRKLREKP